MRWPAVSKRRTGRLGGLGVTCGNKYSAIATIINRSLLQRVNRSPRIRKPLPLFDERLVHDASEIGAAGLIPAVQHALKDLAYGQRLAGFTQHLFQRAHKALGIACPAAPRHGRKLTWRPARRPNPGVHG